VRGGRAFEAAPHQRFAELRIHGEWFRLTDGLRRAIARIVADPYVEVGTAAGRTEFRERDPRRRLVPDHRSGIL